MSRNPKHLIGTDEGGKIELMRLETDLIGMTLTDRDGNYVTVWMSDDALTELIEKAQIAKNTPAIPHS